MQAHNLIQSKIQAKDVHNTVEMWFNIVFLYLNQIVGLHPKTYEDKKIAFKLELETCVFEDKILNNHSESDKHGFIQLTTQDMTANLSFPFLA